MAGLSRLGWLAGRGQPFFGARQQTRHVSAALSGSALRVGVERLDTEFERSVPLRGLLTKSAGEFGAQVMQRSACGLLHTARARFATWLLLGDRVRAGEVEFTQERMAQHLGLRRAGVTVLCQELADAGAIGHTRGRVCFLDRRTME